MSEETILNQIRQQLNEIYKHTMRYCDTVVLGERQLQQLWWQEVVSNPLLPDKFIPSKVLDLDIRTPPFFDGILVLPKHD